MADWLNKINEQEAEKRQLLAAALERRRIAAINSQSMLPSLFAGLKNDCHQAHHDVPSIKGKVKQGMDGSNGWSLISVGYPFASVKFWLESDGLRFEKVSQTSVGSERVEQRGVVTVQCDLDGRSWFSYGTETLPTHEAVSQFLLGDVIGVVTASST